MTALQNPRSFPKYERVYGFLRTVIEAVARDQGLSSNVAKYNFLKDIYTPAWDLATRADPSEVVKSGDVWGFCRAYNLKPTQWFREGREYSGTERDFRVSFDDAITTALLTIPSDRDLILDLGCGWGHRMFDLWRAGGPRTARYVGCERASPSADCVKMTGALFPEMSIQTSLFDFLNPDFGTLDGKRIGVFSVCAIEQIKYVGTDLLNRLFKHFQDADIVGVHLEPITHQVCPDDEADRAFAERFDFNMDFFDVLRAHPRVKIDRVIPRLVGRTGSHTVTAVIWKSVAAKA